MVLLKVFRGGVEDLVSLGVDARDVEGVEGRREVGIGLMVGEGGLRGSEVVDEPVDEVFIFGSFGDTDVLDGHEGPFLGDDEVDEIEELFGAEDVGAGGHDEGDVLGGEVIVAAEAGVGGDPGALHDEEFPDLVFLVGVEGVFRFLEEVEGGKIDRVDRVVGHCDLVIDDGGVEDHFPGGFGGVGGEVVFVDAEAVELPLEGDRIGVLRIVIMAEEGGVDGAKVGEFLLVDFLEEVFFDEDVDGVVGGDDEVVAFSTGSFEFDDEFFVGGVVAEGDLHAGLFFKVGDDGGLEDVAPDEDVDRVGLSVEEFPLGPVESGEDER